MKHLTPEEKEPIILARTALGFALAGVAVAIMMVRYSSDWSEAQYTLLYWYSEIGGAELDKLIHLQFGGFRLLEYLFVLFISLVSLHFLNTGYYYRQNFGKKIWRANILRFAGAILAIGIGLWTVCKIIGIIIAIPVW